MSIALKNIKNAQKRITPYTHRTPVLTSNTLNHLSGAELFLKCENFQKTGAFKFRGALNTVLSLGDEELKQGVATHSSGNHGAALALAGRIRRTPVYVVMPDNASEIKKRAVAGYGAEIVFCKPTLAARVSALEDLLLKTGAEMIHPYNDERIIAGQGTAALELLEDHPDLDCIVAPVGGGGLLSGTALASKGINSDIRVIGGEPKGANDAYLSLKAGKIIPQENPQTIADGLLTSLGDKTFPVIKQYVDGILTVSEEEIIQAMKLILSRMKILVEPSSAVALAALLKSKEEIPGKKVGIILSGGNVDIDHFPWTD